MNFENVETRVQLIEEDVLVGYIEYTKTPKLLILEDLYVYPGYRENGYAKIICDEFIRLSQKEERGIETNCWYFIEMYS